MGMTIDEAIGIITAKGNYSYTVIENEAKDVLIDIARKYQMVQADYENRLKADLKAILVELQLKIEELRIEYILADYEEDINTGIEMAADAIQEKINELDGEQDPTPQK